VAAPGDARPTAEAGQQSWAPLSSCGQQINPRSGGPQSVELQQG